MISKTITAILFDFGGVLAEEGFRNGLVSLAKEQGLDADNITEEGMRTVYDSGFVLGKGTAENFWSLMKQRTGLKGEDGDLTRRILDGFIVRRGMVELVKKLRKRGYVTGILSDQTYWLNELEERYHFAEAFTHIFNSYYLGKGKRDTSLFTDISVALEIPPESILFVDDDEGNVNRAINAGFRGIRFIDEDSFERSLEEILSGNLQVHY